eukprot:scaffold5954_cov48-Phaeocystis_antarctica.AAC.1
MTKKKTAVTILVVARTFRCSAARLRSLSAPDTRVANLCSEVCSANASRATAHDEADAAEGELGHPHEEGRLGTEGGAAARDDERRVIVDAANLREPARLVLVLPPAAGRGLYIPAPGAEGHERRGDEVCREQPQRGRLGELADRPEHKLAEPEREEGHAHDVQTDGQPWLPLGRAERREHQEEADRAGRGTPVDLGGPVSDVQDVGADGEDERQGGRGLSEGD